MDNFNDNNDTNIDKHERLKMESLDTTNDHIDDDDEEEFDEQVFKQLRAGSYLKKKRLATGENLSKVAKALGVSHPYISDIERGLKVPSDQIIKLLASRYGINEDDLFRRYGKVPILAREELENRPILQKTLSEISSDKRLTDDEKNSLYDKIYNLYVNYGK